MILATLSSSRHAPEIISIQTNTKSPDIESNTGDDAIFSLPNTLHEYAITVKGDKPLLLLYILNKYRLQEKTLIFTHSTETATRLNHLLTTFYKSSNSDVTTAVISSEVPLKSRKKLLSSFTSGKLNMYISPCLRDIDFCSVITTDLLSRGMDIKGIQHVVNYDSSPTARVYVHRAGRTARAGREGDVWTLITNKESRWFWKQIMSGIKRNNAIERISFPEIPQQIKETYNTIIES